MASRSTLAATRYVKPRRPSPGLESASQDIPRRVLISIQGTTAFAGVPALVQVFRNNLTAGRALLSRSPRFHFHEGDPGTLSLGSQRLQKAGPAGIRDRSSQPAVPEHPLSSAIAARPERCRRAGRRSWGAPRRGSLRGRADDVRVARRGPVDGDGRIPRDHAVAGRELEPAADFIPAPRPRGGSVREASVPSRPVARRDRVEPRTIRRRARLR
jgi:hypothetical protein